MKVTPKHEKPKDEKPGDGRRRFLGLLGGLGAAGLALPLLPRRKTPEELGLREADFYRPHDLAG